MPKAARVTSYKNLIVYRKAKLLTRDMIRCFSEFRLPKTQEFIVIQLLRATSSVGANIAEGYGRHYKKSYRQFLSIARGSVFEADYWLELVLELKRFDKKTILGFIKRNEELAKMLTTMMIKLNSA